MVVVSSYHEMLSHYVPAPQLVRPQSSLQAGCYFQGLAAPKSTDYKDSSAFFFFDGCGRSFSLVCAWCDLIRHFLNGFSHSPRPPRHLSPPRLTDEGKGDCSVSGAKEKCSSTQKR